MPPRRAMRLMRLLPYGITASDLSCSARIFACFMRREERGTPLTRRARCASAQRERAQAMRKEYVCRAAICYDARYSHAITPKYYSCRVASMLRAYAATQARHADEPLATAAKMRAYFRRAREPHAKEVPRRSALEVRASVLITQPPR